MTITDHIDEFIAKEGKGNIRDALNVALCRWEVAEAVIRRLRRELEDAQRQLIKK